MKMKKWAKIEDEEVEGEEEVLVARGYDNVENS